MKKLYKNNKFKISAPTWNGEFELHNGSCSISDIQECLKQTWEKAVNPSITIIFFPLKIFTATPKCS